LLSEGGTDMPMTGIRLWLKADAGLGPAGGLNIWPDQSGLGNDAVQSGVASTDPILVTSATTSGLPVVSFNGGGQGLSLPTNPMKGANQGEIFVVVQAKVTVDSFTNPVWNFGTSGQGTNYYNWQADQVLDDFGSNQQYNEAFRPSP
jgi:hypothetical protein